MPLAILYQLGKVVEDATGPLPRDYDGYVVDRVTGERLAAPDGLVDGDTVVSWGAYTITGTGAEVVVDQPVGPNPTGVALLMGGQSLSSGLADPAPADPGLLAAWYTYRTAAGVDADPSASIGPEWGIMRGLANAGQKVQVGHHAVGGTGSADWDATEKASLYALGDAMEGGCTPRALVWDHGQWDARQDLPTAEAYGAWLATFHAELQAKYGDFFVFIVAELGTLSGTYTWRDEVQAGIEAFVAADPTRRFMTDTIGLVEVGADSVHLTIDGYDTLGTLHATTLVTAGVAHAIPPRLASVTATPASPTDGDNFVADHYWSGTQPQTYAYQWQVDGVDVPGETAEQYTAIPEDTGYTIEATATGAGAASSESGPYDVAAAPTVPDEWAGARRLAVVDDIVRTDTAFAIPADEVTVFAVFDVVAKTSLAGLLDCVGNLKGFEVRSLTGTGDDASLRLYYRDNGTQRYKTISNNGDPGDGTWEDRGIQRIQVRLVPGTVDTDPDAGVYIQYGDATNETALTQQAVTGAVIQSGDCGKLASMTRGSVATSSIAGSMYMWAISGEVPAGFYDSIPLTSLEAARQYVHGASGITVVAELAGDKAEVPTTGDTYDVGSDFLSGLGDYGWELISGTARLQPPVI